MSSWCLLYGPVRWDFTSLEWLSCVDVSKEFQRRIVFLAWFCYSRSSIAARASLPANESHEGRWDPSDWQRSPTPRGSTFRANTQPVTDEHPVRCCTERPSIPRESAAAFGLFLLNFMSGAAHTNVLKFLLWLQRMLYILSTTLISPPKWCDGCIRSITENHVGVQTWSYAQWARTEEGQNSAFPLAACILVGHRLLWTDTFDKTQKVAQQVRIQLGTWRWKCVMYLFPPKNRHGLMSKYGWVQECPFAWPSSAGFALSYHYGGCLIFSPNTPVEIMHLQLPGNFIWLTLATIFCAICCGKDAQLPSKHVFLRPVDSCFC